MKILKYSLLWVLCAVLWSCEDDSSVTYNYDFSGIVASAVDSGNGYYDFQVIIPASNRDCFGMLSIGTPYSLKTVDVNLVSGNVTDHTGVLLYDKPKIENLPNGSLSVTCHIKYDGGTIRLYYNAGTCVNESFIVFPPDDAGGYWGSEDRCLRWSFKW